MASTRGGGPRQRDASSKIASAKPCQVTAPAPAKWYVPQAALPFADALRDLRDRAGDVRRAGRGADLVGDDPQHRALSGEAQHRLDEIVPVRAVDPGGAQDNVLAQRLAHGALAGLLARAVNPQRIDRIVLSVGAALGAVEDIIGRDMDQRNAGFAARRRDIGRSDAIGGPSGIGLALGAVHRRIGGGVDDDVRADVGDCREHRLTAA